MTTRSTRYAPHPSHASGMFSVIRQRLVLALMSLIAVCGLTGCNNGISDSSLLTVEGKGVEIANGSFLANILDGTDFGTVSLGQTATVQTFTVTNNSGLPIEIKGDATPVSLTGGADGDFTVASQLPPLIEAGQSASFSISFTPTAAGLRTTIVSFRWDDGTDKIFSFRVQGSGGSLGDIQILDPTTALVNPLTPFNFGTQNVGTGTRDLTFFIRNNASNGTLTLTSDVTAISGSGFSILTQPVKTIAPGAQVPFVVRYAPATAGAKQMIFGVTSSDALDPAVVFQVQGSTNPAMSLPALTLPVADG